MSRCNSTAAAALNPCLHDLIDAGVDAVNPIQISCQNMDTRQLKAKYGDRLTFWGGGCDTHRRLHAGTPQEIKEHVREQVALLKPGGGFVFQQVHNILANVPPENVLAMFEAVHDSH